MHSQRWQQIDELFQAAVELDPAQRASFLEQSCADDQALRSAVESMLASDSDDWDFVEKPVLQVAAPLLVDEYPQLAPDETISHYSIIAAIGKGGMGEVYLAQDERLGRKVALKLLPDEFTRDPSRMRRFQQEARAASALNHPNILTIHDIGEFDGQHFIASEFIDGETLRQRLRQEGISIAETLDIAIQIASALAVAHEAGIVHRDIKPENIMLRRDGYVKVLDFGLAKLAGQDEPARTAGAEEKPDISSGLLMGTIKYMSPEQAQGLAVDQRSDIFGLGVVLYEMITGRCPFDGDTPGKVIASLLEDEPPLLNNYVSDLPDGIQGIISKCLRKSRGERYQTAKDLLADLNDLRRRLERQSDLARDQASPHTLTSASSIIGESRRQRLRVVMILAGLALVAVILFAFFKFLGVGKRAAAFQNITITRLTSSGVTRDAAISPDGKYIAYVVEEQAQQTIWMKEVATETAVQLVPPGAKRLAALTFSRDGLNLFYVRYDKGSPSNTLYRMSVADGQVTRVIAEVHSPISFAPDGKRFAFFRRYEGRNALLIANADGTEEMELTSRSGTDRLVDYPCGPAWSPDGQVIFCASRHQEAVVSSSFTTFVGVSVGGGAERIIPAGDLFSVTGLAWLADGSGLMMSAYDKPEQPGNSQIWHISYPGGEVRRITNDFTDYTGMSITADSNVLVASQRYVTANIWVSPKENPSQARLINAPKSLYYGLSWTADGRIVYSQKSKDGADLWVMNQDGTNRVQLTHNSGTNMYPSVTPDGKSIVLGSIRSGSGRIWKMDIDGQNPKQLAEVGFPYPILSPDGRWVSFYSTSPSTQTDARRIQWWRVSIDGGEPVQVLEDNIYSPAISPDGKFVAYIYRKSEAIPPQDIEVIPFGGGKVIKRFSLPKALLTQKFFGDFQLTWSADGQALTYYRGNLWSQSIDGSPPKQLTDFQGEDIVFYTWSPDGKQLACICVARSFDTVLINNSN